VTANDLEISANMILMPGEKNANLAVANGHMYEKEIASAIEYFRKVNNDLPLYSDMKQLLQAELLGTRVVDQGSIQVFIRGNYINANGFSENNGAATFVLDGMMVRDIDDLNPQDVRFIRLLKGHEATRMYGSRGADGVVLINTK
jgi:TonB-dependent SusC/RagA subfamily outer membrane receptor